MTNVVRPQVMLQRSVLVAVGLFVVWIALVGTLDPSELIVGAGVAGLATGLSVSRLDLLDGIRLRPSLPFHLVRYFARFSWALVLANVDVARRVASPGRLRIRPAIVDVHTDLKSDLGRLWLANSITLTPGTLTVEVEGEMLKVHWIDVPPGVDLVAATRAIAADFEAVLREIVL